MAIYKIKAGVVGAGAVGVCVCNLLSVLGIPNYHFGHKPKKPKEYMPGYSSNQKMQLTGVPFFYDPVKSIHPIFFKAYHDIDWLLERSSGEILESRSLLVLSQNQLDYIESIREDLSPFEPIGRAGISTIKSIVGKNYDGRNRHVQIYDKPFDIADLMNRLENFSLKSSYTKSRDRNVRLKLFPNSKVGIVDQNDVYIPDHLFLCCGYSSFSMLEQITTEKELIFVDKSLIEHGYEEQFEFVAIRTPLLRTSQNFGFDSPLIVDLRNGFALVRNPVDEDFVLASSLYSEEIPFNYNTSTINRDLTLFRKLHSKLQSVFGEVIPKAPRHCIRIERRIKKLDEAYHNTTISNWSGKIPKFENLVFGIPGKATLAMDTAERMVKDSGITKRRTLEFKADYKNMNKTYFTWLDYEV